jgi:hypothetical protein
MKEKTREGVSWTDLDAEFPSKFGNFFFRQLLNVRMLPVEVLVERFVIDFRVIDRWQRVDVLGRKDDTVCRYNRNTAPNAFSSRTDEEKTVFLQFLSQHFSCYSTTDY